MSDTGCYIIAGILVLLAAVAIPIDDGKFPELSSALLCIAGLFVMAAVVS